MRTPASVSRRSRSAENVNPPISVLHGTAADIGPVWGPKPPSTVAGPLSIHAHNPDAKMPQRRLGNFLRVVGARALSLDAPAGGRRGSEGRIAGRFPGTDTAVQHSHKTEAPRNRCRCRRSFVRLRPREAEFVEKPELAQSPRAAAYRHRAVRNDGSPSRDEIRNEGTRLARRGAVRGPMAALLAKPPAAV